MLLENKHILLLTLSVWLFSRGFTANALGASAHQDGLAVFGPPSDLRSGAAVGRGRRTSGVEIG